VDRGRVRGVKCTHFSAESAPIGVCAGNHVPAKYQSHLVRQNKLWMDFWKRSQSSWVRLLPLPPLPPPNSLPLFWVKICKNCAIAKVAEIPENARTLFRVGTTSFSALAALGNSIKLFKFDKTQC
jgi:hypothetical protein